jgi:hypothetical protein
VGDKGGCLKCLFAFASESLRNSCATAVVECASGFAGGGVWVSAVDDLLLDAVATDDARLNCCCAAVGDVGDVGTGVGDVGTGTGCSPVCELIRVDIGAEVGDEGASTGTGCSPVCELIRGDVDAGIGDEGAGTGT